MKMEISVQVEKGDFNLPYDAPSEFNYKVEDGKLYPILNDKVFLTKSDTKLRPVDAKVEEMVGMEVVYRDSA